MAQVTYPDFSYDCEALAIDPHTRCLTTSRDSLLDFGKENMQNVGGGKCIEISKRTYVEFRGRYVCRISGEVCQISGKNCVEFRGRNVCRISGKNESNFGGESVLNFGGESASNFGGYPSAQLARSLPREVTNLTIQSWLDSLPRETR